MRVAPFHDHDGKLFDLSDASGRIGLIEPAFDGMRGTSAVLIAC
jgi:hypothetical protein